MKNILVLTSGYLIGLGLLFTNNSLLMFIGIVLAIGSMYQLSKTI